MLKLLTNVSSSTGQTAGRILASRSVHQAGRIGSRAVTKLAVGPREQNGFRSAPQRFANAPERMLHTSRVFCNELQTIKCPQLSESLSEGDIRLVKAVGDQVAVDDVLAEVETDKTSIPIHSPVAGVIEKFLVEDGSTVKPGQDIVQIKVGATGGATAAAPTAAAPEPAAPVPEAAPAPAAAPDEEKGKDNDTEKAQEMQSLKQQKEQVPEKSPKRSLFSRLRTRFSAAPPVPPKQTDSSKSLNKDIKIPAFDTLSTPVAGSRTETRVKMNRMRLRIAERLKDAQNTYAMLTTFNEIDMTRLTEIRNKSKDAFQKKHGVKMGFMSAFVKASAYALKDQPVVNAVIDGNETIYRDYVDISVAVSTPKGLVVPVIRNADLLDYAGIEKYIAQLGEKARTGALAIEDMDGGTFTISNGGVFGSLFGTPIINPPQSAILGMHAIQQRPVVINNEIKIRPMMYVCLTYDHRLIDGREAVTFLKKIKEGVEEPASMFLG